MYTYKNPIIPGFYPDPSICRVGEDYYLVCSSFEYFPGVPLWHSRDLVNWEQLGYVLTRESQLPLAGCRISGGIYAPTIRYHEGRFYMITTNTHQGGNFLVWTDDIRGEWSDPVWIDHDGIDPSLFWDDDGRVYYTGTYRNEEGYVGIGQFRLDPETGEKLSDARIIWFGTGGRCPEAPHMYKLNGWYYLLIAEGGTEYGHMVTIARSRNVWGPFESCPRNPILTHRDHIDGEFQGLGHSDIVTDTDGSWWIVFHGIRPSAGMLHHMGRETMLAPFVWDEDGWPLINGGRHITAVMEGEGLAAQQYCHTWRDDFTETTIHPRWSWLRNPNPENYALRDGSLILRGSAFTLSDLESPAFLGVRQQQFTVSWQTEIRLAGENGCAGITVFHNAQQHYDLCVKRRPAGYAVTLRRKVADMETETQPVLFENIDSLVLRVDAQKLMYTFRAGTSEESLITVGTGSTQLLSKEVMPCTFTGCFAGLFTEGETEAAFACFCTT